MKKRGERGFSLIELLIVVVIVGIIAALAVPALQKAIRAAENGNTFSLLRTASSAQMSFYTQNSRFGRLNEVNNLLYGAMGTPSGNELIRGKFIITMTPPVPTDAELREGYTITATRDVLGEGVVYQYALDQSGEIRQILP